MATINGKGNHIEQGVWQTVWTPLAAADSGTPEQVDRYPDKSVQFDGTFNGATVVLEGCDDQIVTASSTFLPIKDRFGNAVSATVASRFDLEAVPHNVRPRSSSGGGSTALTCTLTCKSMGR